MCQKIEQEKRRLTKIISTVYYYWSFWSSKVNKKPLTILLAIGLGIRRHKRPSRYAIIPDKTNLPIPNLHITLPFPLCSCPTDASTIGFPSVTSNFSFNLILVVTLPACFRRARIIKLTKRCSHRVKIVGPIFQSCNSKAFMLNLYII